MHINKSLEAIFLARIELPIDRTLFICFTVVLVKVFQEICADNLACRTFSAQCIRNELEVLLERFRAIRSTNKFNKPANNIVFKVFIVCNGENIVFIRHEGDVCRIRHFIKIGIYRIPLVSQN